MATFYLDFENGNDANDGTTFANRWKTLTSGATAARIAPGDEIRIMGSPAPTSLGQNGVWTSQALQATKSISSSTNATPIAITCTSHGYSTGDTVVITGHSTNTNANGTWEITVTGANTFTLDGSAGNGVGGASGTVRLRNNTRVMLTTPVTQNIASTGPERTAWTASTNALAVLTAGLSPKEGYYTDQITVQTAFTTGKAAYYTLPATLDLSAYQQVSFWIQLGTLTSGQAELRLCSDSTGDTAVNTVSIPSVPATSRWQPVTVDLSTNLGNSVNSIALYVTTDLSTTANVAIYFSNIIACKASSEPDSLTLTSLIGKNTTGETFWGIQSINGTRVMLDADTNATPTSSGVRGYYGTSETVTTWKRETIKLGPAVGISTTLQTIQDSGTDGNPITFSGGWDRANMSTQTLETWLDGVNGHGYAIVTASRSWLVFSNLSFSRFGGVYSTGSATFCTFGAKTISNLSSESIVWATTAREITVDVDFIIACATLGIQKSTNAQTNGVIFLGYGVLSNGNTGISSGSSAGVLKVFGKTSNALIANNGSYALAAGSNFAVYNIKTENNGTGGLLLPVAPNAYLYKCVIGDTTEVDANSTTQYSAFTLQSHDHDQTTGNHKIFGDGYRISAATDERHTASGISWKIQPTVSDRINSTRPVILSLAKVACAANSLVTVKAWMYRDNSGLTMRLVCKGGQIAGVDNDVTASVTTTNAWEEETITFTPTETGVVEITAEAWGGTTFSGWVDDMTISQA